MRDIIELGNGTVPEIGACEAMLLVILRAEVADDDNSRMIWADQNRAYQGFKVFH